MQGKGKKMPRKTSTAIPDTTGPVRTPLDAIPDELKAYLEDVYKRQAKTPGRERVEYDTEDELKAEFKLMADYLAQRPEGALRIRKSPTRDQADNVMDFRITADLEANGARNAGNDRKQTAANK
jgi:carbon monoxide dehydrogenase subunit G